MKKEEDATDGLELRISKKSWRTHLTEELWSKEKGSPQNFTDLEFRSVSLKLIITVRNIRVDS